MLFVFWTLEMLGLLYLYLLLYCYCYFVTLSLTQHQFYLCKGGVRNANNRQFF